MFYRSILTELKKWKNRDNRKPLIIRGARQVGKTTAINLFSHEFDNYIYLNLELHRDREIFKENLDVHRLLQAILVHKNITLKPGSTLIFLDEIQNSPVAIKMLRYFYEELPEIYVIGAGSLLEVMLKENKTSFPAGRVEFLYIFPVSFHEFLIAKGEQTLLSVYEEIPVPEYAHRKLLDLFHEYTMIGGMPEIIKNHLEKKYITSLNSTYESLVRSYIDDCERYARNESQRQILRHCINTLPYEAGKRIKFQGFGRSNYRSREIGEALRLLEKAMLIYLIFPSTFQEFPLQPDYRKSPKLQFIDTGLINYYMGLQPEFFKYEDLHSFYKGIIAEHIVRQELIAKNTFRKKTPLFWVREKKQSSAEVDILIEHENIIIPAEVKSGKSGKLRSLHQFINKSNYPFAMRFYSGPFNIIETKTPEGKHFLLMNLPYYLAGKSDKYAKLFVEGKLR